MKKRNYKAEHFEISTNKQTIIEWKMSEEDEETFQLRDGNEFFKQF